MQKFTPAVFAVGREYQILIPARSNTFCCVKIGSQTYYDACSGVVRSMTVPHRIHVPADVLDNAGQYTVCIRAVPQRKPYFTAPNAPVERSFSFRPVPAGNIRAYHVADAHNHIRGPLKAAASFGPIDVLILNGDLISYCSNTRDFNCVYQICSQLTGGQIPVICSRGNHDMRGRIAEKFFDYIPHDHGNTYYTFRLGSIWGVILDCGEDKPDTHEAYGGTVACHGFRLKQIDFLRSLAENAESEYAADGVQTRLVICHAPFTERNEPPFNIEEDIYRQWCDLIKIHIRPHLMICGHTHQAQLRPCGHPKDNFGQSCPVVIASGFDDRSYWTGCGFEFEEDRIRLTYTDSNGRILSTHVLPKEP